MDTITEYTRDSAFAAIRNMKCDRHQKHPIMKDLGNGKFKLSFCCERFAKKAQAVTVATLEKSAIDYTQKKMSEMVRRMNDQLSR